jgi:hypothetical protein
VSRHMILLGAIVAAAGSAIAGPATQPRGGSSTLGRAPAPQPRGGRGSLGGYLQRRPSTDRFRGRGPSSRGLYYPGFYYDPFFYSPFYADPFFYDRWGSYYSRGYRSEDGWPDRGNVALLVEPRDVEVIVDGIPSAKGGRAVLSLPTGPHHIEIRRSGYRTWALDLDVKQGVRYRLEQRLERVPKGEKEEDTDSSSVRTAGELRLDVQPSDAFVDLEGRFLGMASLLRDSAALRRIPIGHHTLRFRREGYRTVERAIDVTSDRPAEVRVELERE